MRPALAAVTLAVLAAVIEPGVALAERSACGPFRVEWNRGVLSPTSEKLEGFVYNDSPCSLANVLPPRGRGYFALPLSSSPAVEYRVNVVSFDEVMSPQAP